MSGINGWRLSASVIPAATGHSHQTVKIKGLSDTEVEFSLSLLGAKLSKPPLGRIVILRHRLFFQTFSKETVYNRNKCL